MAHNLIDRLSGHVTGDDETDGLLQEASKALEMMSAYAEFVLSDYQRACDLIEWAKDYRPDFKTKP